MDPNYLDRIESLALEGDIIKALRLCIRIGSAIDDDFTAWARSELNGYYADVALPDYRKIIAPLYYDASSQAGKFSCWELSVLGLPTEARPFVSDKLHLNVSIVELQESVTSSEKESRLMKLAHPQSSTIANIMNQSGQYNVRIDRIYWLVSRSVIGSIVERINTEVIQQVSRLAVKMQPATTLRTERFHSWVWDKSRSLWASKNYREAVGTAAAEVEKQTQAKLDRGNLSGADLYTQAFKVDKIREIPDGPRLRFPGLDELTEDGKRNQSWKSAHEGAMHFGRGCAQGIRNLNAHGTDDLPEQEAIEYLAALSVLARWVDICDVVNATHA